MNPVSFVQSAIAAAIAFALGALIAGVPAYFVGSAHGKESKMGAIGALKTSVDSCTSTATEAKRIADDEAKAGEARERRIDEAIRAGMADAARIGRQRSAVLATPPRGNTECERTSNMIADQFRAGGKP